MPRLALALMLYLGVRRGDAFKLGRQHLTAEGTIRFVPEKTKYRRKDISEKYVLPELARIIKATPCGDLTFILSSHGRPFKSKEAFGNWFGIQCDLAGLPHCSAHGLRKAGATMAANAGATDRQLMDLYDWTSEAQANKYTAARDKKRNSEAAARLLDQEAGRHLERGKPLLLEHRGNNELSHLVVAPEKKARNQ